MTQIIFVDGKGNATPTESNGARVCSGCQETFDVVYELASHPIDLFCEECKVSLC